MAFTSWSDLKSRMLDDLASGMWCKKSYKLGDVETVYRDFSDFKAAMEFVIQKAAEESASSSIPIARTFARSVGRFSR